MKAICPGFLQRECPKDSGECEHREIHNWTEHCDGPCDDDDGTRAFYDPCIKGNLRIAVFEALNGEKGGSHESD